MKIVKQVSPSESTQKPKILTKADKFVESFNKVEKESFDITKQAVAFLNMSASEQKGILGKLSENSRIHLSEFISSVLCGYTPKDVIAKKAMALVQYKEEAGQKGVYNIISPESGRNLKIIKSKPDCTPWHSFVILGSKGEGVSRIYC